MKAYIYSFGKTVTKSLSGTAHNHLCSTILTCVLLSLAACGHTETNFSQYPGFAEYFEQNPRSERPPNATESVLLEHYRPRLFIGPEQDGPISFYDEYIAHGSLYDKDGELISGAVDRALLNTYKQDPRVVFVHEPAETKGRLVPIAFGRIDRHPVPEIGEVTFLSYHFVFRYSGVPAGIPGWQDLLIKLIADPDDWHQLDHYTAATVALDPSLTPIAVILQQHNYLHTYLIGRDIDLPVDKRIMITSAIRSNELYPYQKSPTRYRAVQFMTPETIRYLVTGEGKPFLSADEIAHPAREVDYKLDFIPQTDAFYVFEGYLGERRCLPGRDGPPGADYNAQPRFKSKAVQLVAFNWQEDNIEQMEEIIMLISGTPSEVNEEAFDNLSTRFRAQLNEVRAQSLKQ